MTSICASEAENEDDDG